MSIIAAAFLLAVSQAAPAEFSFKVLLVGESYATNSIGLAQLHGANDCKVLRSAIAGAYPAQFTEIENASKLQIASAWHTMEVNARPGDALVFFFSGHGTLAHDGAGNICSAIVPADAARKPNGAFDESTLLTRDFFNQSLKALTRQTGNVTLIFDCCASGLLARGTMVAKFANNPGVDQAAGDRVPLPATDLNVGASVLIAASRADRSAYEDSTQSVGVLTLALSSALVQSRPGAINYAMLRDATIAQLAASSSSTGQEPIFAGDLDRVVFGGNRITASATVPVSVQADGSVSIAAGRILGFAPGVRIALYRAGAPLAGQPTATAQVATSTLYASTLKILSGTISAADAGAWGFRIVDAAPDAVVDVDTTLLTPKYAKILAHIESLPLVRNNSGASAAIILIPPGATLPNHQDFDHSPTDWIAATTDGNAISHFDGSNSPDDVQQWVDETIRDVGRVQAVLGLKTPNPWIDVQMELVPATTRPSKDAEGNAYEVVTTLDQAHGAGSCSASEGERFAVRVRASWAGGRVSEGNPLAEAPYISVLDITARKKVSQAWPTGDSANPDRLRAPLDGKWHYLGTDNSLVEASDTAHIAAWFFRPKEDGVGPEVFKLLATDQPVDYAPVLTRSRGDARGMDNPLVRILNEFQNGKPLKRDPIDTGPPPPSKFAVTQVVISVHFAITR